MCDMLLTSLSVVTDDQYCLLYLAVVTGCTSVGKICGSEVFKVTQTALISLQANPGDDDRVTEVRELSHWYAAGNSFLL